MAKKFSMAELAKEALGDVHVSEVDRVQTIDVGLILANKANFYEMSDLEELAASIELVGLLHPVVVKPREGAGYVLIDGERRFRAMTDVLGRTEIPCIVRQPVNEVVEELMLIEANRTQRKMSAADLSKQAERYTELLAQLKQAGAAIPGRLRDRVAEALQVSSTKLARLHAIRENCIPEILEDFDAGKLNESVAYKLSQEPEECQQAVYMYDGYMPESLTAEDVRPLVSRAYAAAQAKDRKPVNESHAVPSRLSWDAEEYMRQRRQEDEDFYLMLGLEADHFLAQLAYVTSRQDGIQTLKEHFGRDHSGWFYDEVCVNCSMKGLELGCEDRAIPFIERTWTDVYDMLCRHVLAAGARQSRVSKVDQKPAGVEWHRIDPEHKPLFDFQKTVLLWGPGGLRSVPQNLIYDTIKYAPETVTHWAVIEGPEEGEND